MQQVFWPGFAAVAFMYAAFSAIGWLAARKVREGTAAELLVAGRMMPLWIATLTMTATWVDGGYLLGTVEGTFTSLASGVQGGLFFGISLILGGLFFARRMRQLEFTTLVDPFECRYGKGWAAVLFIPAMLGEVFWSGELLVALGATFQVILGMDLTTTIILSAVVVTAYTMIGGMWSVAYTDAFQLALIPIGLLIAMPFALEQVGGLWGCIDSYRAAQGPAAMMIPPVVADSFWSSQKIASWWDLSAMLALGGIPWNCYFQRVLSCQTPAKAVWHSLLAGVLTILLTIPPLILGMAAFQGLPSAAELGLPLESDRATSALPLLLRYMTPPWVAILGLGAIIGAVTSSFSSSILSAGSMFSWNVYRRLVHPAGSVDGLRLVIRLSILLLGAGAAYMALHVSSVQQLWFFSSDLVFVLLFPQLLWALYDPKANRTGSIAAFAAAFVLRLGGGEPLFGIPPFIPYPTIFASVLPGTPADWYDSSNGALLFPYKSLAALVGLVVLPVVSRLTASWDPPRPLQAGDSV